MAKKRHGRRPRAEETLTRQVVITSLDPCVSFSPHNLKEPEPEVRGRPWLRLRGTLAVPIRDTVNVEFSLWSDPDRRVGPARPVAVAYVNQIRPVLSISGHFAPGDFEYLWGLALAGLLKHAYLSLTKPHYNSASVLYMSFSAEPEE